MSEPQPTPVVSSSPRWNRRISVRAIAIMLGATVLMFVVGYFIAVRILFPPLPEPENGTAVPNLVGLSVENAENQLRLAGLRLTEVSTLEHPTEPVGRIIAQSPLAGQQLRDLGAVRVAVSSGPGHIEPAPAPAQPAPTPADSTAPTPAPPPADDTIAPPDTVSFYLQ